MLGTRTKRTAGPCDHCKRRKRKCDARMPTCAACERSNIECLYTANSEQRRPVHRQYVASLEARISLLEKILKDAEASDTTDSSDAGVSLPDENDFQSQSLTATSGSSLPSSPSTKIAPESRLTLIDDPGDILKSTLDPTTPLNSEEPDLGMSGYEIILSLEHEHKLLAQFWDWQRMHHPYVVPVPFLSAYAVHSELAHPGEPIPPPPPPLPNSSAGATLNVPRASTVKRTSDLPHFISPLLLYSMFAIAALFSGDPGTGTLFYQHARETLLREAANPKVATIQAVCLMTTWELGHARSPAAWALFGKRGFS
ncbi:fungal zn(2)-Cys(6) binuclear cluster domain-containing protein [Rhizoctonia solani AG-1 IA]|uniref:Fungal zn(2)-Cys(6) binuclear cluster domain-containing protein n=1 Tax=Thanatephorus cucumeris (strain AG1-IA) TaxID=983506 RepID=L8WTB5_THACA|nr:fungal zn(2)-Cys(6) binuclear cluster domain-containing protein [Rhizoctonia solani AG-1 IA]